MQPWVWDGHTREWVVCKEGAETFVGFGPAHWGWEAEEGVVLPWWPLPSMPGWIDPEGGLGKAGDLEEIRGEG